MVSAALVAHREVDKEAGATAGLADDKPELPLAGPGAGKVRPPAEFDAGGQGLRNQTKWCRKRK